MYFILTSPGTSSPEQLRDRGVGVCVEWNICITLIGQYLSGLWFASQVVSLKELLSEGEAFTQLIWHPAPCRKKRLLLTASLLLVMCSCGILFARPEVVQVVKPQQKSAWLICHWLQRLTGLPPRSQARAGLAPSGIEGQVRVMLGVSCKLKLQMLLKLWATCAESRDLGHGDCSKSSMFFWGLDVCMLLLENFIPEFVLTLHLNKVLIIKLLY